LYYNQFLCRFKNCISEYCFGSDFKKVAQGGEYQNFSWNKKFFIHFFFLVRIQFELSMNFMFDFQ